MALSDDPPGNSERALRPAGRRRRPDASAAVAPAYDEPRSLVVEVAGRDVAIVTKPGFPAWDALTPSTLLLADAIRLDPAATVLLLGCGHGALGVALARQLPAGRIGLSDTNHVALAMARLTLAANGVENAVVLAPTPTGTVAATPVDVVVLEAPQDRELARRWLLEADRILAPGGRCYLAGENNRGIRSIVDDARALFGDVTLLDARMRSRAARAIKVGDPPAPPAWAAEPGIAPGTWRHLDAVVRGVGLRLRTLPGVFAHERLDDATPLLIETLEVPAGGRLLDVGCGYGAIGLWGARLGAATVDLIDANLLAVAAAAENIRANRIVGAEAMASDALGAVAGRRYDLIASNPPFHSGRDVDLAVAHAFIAQAHHALTPGGRLSLVANAFLRYEGLLESIYGNHRVEAADGRYRVLSAVRRDRSRRA